MVEPKFVYVRFVDDNVCAILPAKNVHNLDNEVIPNKKYRVLYIDGQVYEATIIYHAESEEALQTRVNTNRVRYVPNKLLESDSTDTETQRNTHQNKHGNSSNKKQKAKHRQSSPAKTSETFLRSLLEKTVSKLKENEPQTQVKESSVKTKAVISPSVSSSPTTSSEQILLNCTNCEFLRQEIRFLREDILKKLENNLPAPVRNSSKPVGHYVDGQVHLGHNVFISKELFETLMHTFRKRSDASRLVKNLASAVFGNTTLMNSSVTGRRCNSRKNSTAKPPLDSTKLMAVRETFQYWTTNVLKLNTVASDVLLSKVGEYIAQKIADLTRAAEKRKTPSDNIIDEDKKSEADKQNEKDEENQEDNGSESDGNSSVDEDHEEME